MKKKIIALVLACIICVGIGVGGTLAWLTAQTNEVKNTFSTSDIGVELSETSATYKMVPGWTISKDPKAKVTSGSEDCFLFVKVEKSNNFDRFMDYAIDSQWTLLSDGVYYIEIDQAAEKNADFNILGEGSAIYNGVTYTWADNQVLVKPSVTKGDMAALTDETKPTLTFTAYASQLYKNNTEKFTAAEAWGNIT